MPLDPVFRHKDFVLTTLALLEGRNPYNIGHCRMVSRYADGIARKAGLDEGAIARTRTAAEIHTLGVLFQIEEKKTRYPFPVLGESWRVCREESTLIREERILTDLLSGCEEFETCIPIILFRHAWYDGSGSLHGLAGEEIPVESRILSVADAFVDLVTPKSHRLPASLPEIMAHLKRQAGSQYDPRFVRALDDFLAGEEKGGVERIRRFEEERCRHWIALGNFYRQSGEFDWALRCYRAAQKHAGEIGAIDLEIQGLAGEFLTCLNVEDFERARGALLRVKARAAEADDTGKHLYHLLFGILEWDTGNEETGRGMLEKVAEVFEKRGDLPHLAKTLILFSQRALLRYGASDPTHIAWLEKLLVLLARHDLLDVVIEHRPEVIPLFFSAIRHRIRPALAANFLARLGEPCGAVGVPPPRAAEPVGTRGEAGAGPGTKPVRLRFFGTFRIQGKRKTISEEDWATQKAMKLFAFLAHRADRSYSDEALIGLFWPDKEESKARNSLRNAVHQIRQVLKDVIEEPSAGRFLVRTRRGGMLSLQVPLDLDTDRFEQSLSQGARLVAERKPADALPLLKEAAALYQGDFLENVRDEWTEARRTHLSLAFQKGLRLLAQAYLETGDPEAAEMTARKGLAVDDLQEETHVVLIEALLLQGRKTEALRHYQGALRKFREEIGMENPARLAAVYEKMGRL